jgi:hypothetical protein
LKSSLDKFYTKPEVAALCINTLANITEIDLWLEPSAGAGAFLSRLPLPRLGIDLEPDSDDIIQQDFFTYKPSDKVKVAVIGNPPFGKNSSLAIKFFNHAAEWATIIAFIVPKTFKKTSVQNKLNLNWILQQELALPKNSFDLISDDNVISTYDVPCVWQVWVKGSRKKQILTTTHTDWVWCDKANADYAIRRVGGLAGKCFTDFNTYAESSHYFIKCAPEVYSKISSLYSCFQEAAKNTAGNPSLSKTELVSIYTESCEK